MIKKFRWDEPLFDREDYERDGYFDEWVDEILRLFWNSPEGESFTEIENTYLSVVFQYSLDYGHMGPASLRPEDLYWILIHLFPRKVVMDPKKAHLAIQEIRAFFRFASRKFNSDNARVCSRVLNESTALKMEERLGDHRYFSMSKSFFTYGFEAGFDMSSQEGIDEFTLIYNANPGRFPNTLPDRENEVMPRLLEMPLEQLEREPWEQGPRKPQSRAQQKGKKRKRKLAKKSRRKNRKR